MMTPESSLGKPENCLSFLEVIKLLNRAHLRGGFNDGNNRMMAAFQLTDALLDLRYLVLKSPHDAHSAVMKNINLETCHGLNDM